MLVTLIPRPPNGSWTTQTPEGDGQWLGQQDTEVLEDFTVSYHRYSTFEVIRLDVSSISRPPTIEFIKTDVQTISAALRERHHELLALLVAPSSRKMPRQSPKLKCNSWRLPVRRHVIYFCVLYIYIYIYKYLIYTNENYYLGPLGVYAIMYCWSTYSYNMTAWTLLYKNFKILKSILNTLKLPKSITNSIPKNVFPSCRCQQ